MDENLDEPSWWQSVRWPVVSEWCSPVQTEQRLNAAHHCNLCNSNITDKHPRMLAIIFPSSSFHAQHWAMSYTVHVITRMHARSHVHMDTHTHIYTHRHTVMDTHTHIYTHRHTHTHTVLTAILQLNLVYQLSIDFLSGCISRLCSAS